MQKTIALALAALGLGIAPLGCSSQAAPDYPGESLANLQGELSARSDFTWPADASEIRVGVLWLVSSPDGDREPFVGETAETVGRFPFGFRLSLHAPPPPEAQSYTCPEGIPCTNRLTSEVYQGPLAAFAAGADLDHLRDEDILGVSLTHGLLYFERDADASVALDSVQATATTYNVPATRGYHLYSVEKNEQRYADLRRCMANGLCVRSQVPGGDAARRQQEEYFEECSALVPDALTCTTYPDICRPTPDGGAVCSSYFSEIGIEPSAEQLAEDERCRALELAHAPAAECGELPNPWQFPNNPQGFDARVAIELGASLFDWIF